MMKKLIFLIIICFSGNIILAQNTNLPNYVDSINQGLQLFNSGKYTEALMKYQSVPENDTNFILSVSEQLLTYYYIKEYNKAIELAEKVSKDWEAYLTPNFYLNFGVILDMDKQYDRALNLYEEALKKYPLNYKITYNKGIAHELKKEYKKAFDEYKKVAYINPFYSKVHYRIGNLALTEKKSTLAFLALSTYLLFDPGSEASNTVLNTLNEIASTEYLKKFNPVGVNLSDNNEFSEIDLLISNYVALSKKYKVKSDLNYPVIKVSHLIFTKLNDIPPKDNFWHRIYIPLFKYFINEGLFENYSYYISQSSRNESHKKVLKKKKADIKNFTDIIFETFDELQRRYYLDKRFKNVYRGNGGYAVSALCNLSDNKKFLIDDYQDYFESGSVMSKGKYSKAGKKTGKWEVYNEYGILKEISSMENDIFIDTIYIYSKYGNLAYKYSVKNNELEGDLYIYDESGALTKKMIIISGKNQGNVKEYYTSGVVSADYYVKDDEFNGLYTSYFIDGKVFEKYNYLNGKRDGKDTSFYRNGNIYEIGIRKNEKLNGEYLAFWENGNLQIKSNFKNDLLIGLHETYYKDGSLSSKAHYNEKGELNGIYQEYYPDSRLFCEINYDNGDILSYKYFDKEGAVFDENTDKSGSINYRSYYQNGNKLSKGVFNNKNLQGKWQYFDKYGNLESEGNYIDGVIEGEFLYYYPDGKIYQKDNYNKGLASGHFEMYSPFNIKLYEGYVEDDVYKGCSKNYYPDGTLKDHSFYIDSKLHGYYYEYDAAGLISLKAYYESGVLKRLYNYGITGNIIDTILIENGTKKIIMHNDEGKVFVQYNYFNNSIQGEFFQYFPNGELFVKSYYDCGEIDGKYERYFFNGQKEAELNYEGGLVHGEYIYYHENGKISIKGNSFKGENDGHYKSYYKSGNIETTGSYDKGVRNGKFTYYSQEGDPNHYRYYENGAIVKYEYLSDEGIKSIDCNGSGNFKMYYKNGNLSRSFTLENGWYQGEYKENYFTGELYEKGNFEKNKAHGKWFVYFKNGNIKQENDYQYGEKHGKEIIYHENGKIKKINNYKNDYLYGITQEFELSGKLIHEYQFRDEILIKIIK